MPILTEGNRPGDWLKAESDNQMSRNVGTLDGLSSGTATYESGLVLAQITATGLWVPAASSGADGSQIAKAILLNTTPMTTADKQAVIVDFNARIIDRRNLRWGSTITTQGHRNTALAQLETNSKIKANVGA